MLLLITYILIALVFSFLCSIAEAVILSITPSYISLLERENPPSGKLLRELTTDIQRPLSAILSLNTIAHTMGAAGAGAQAAVVFGDGYLGLISAALTFLILVFSEIIPKTIGATYWRALAAPTGVFLKYLITALYPLVSMSERLTSGFKEDAPTRGMSRKEMLAIAEISAEEGLLAEQEMNFVHNVLNLHKLKVKDAMTPRTVIFSVSEDMNVETYFHKHDSVEFSRVPIYEGGVSEHITGFVLKSDLFLAQARGNGAKRLFEYKRSMITMLPNMPLASALQKFIDNRSNMILVVDEYGGLEGVLSMEDLLEALLGIDIVDENDKTKNMKKLAKALGKKKVGPEQS